MDSNIKLCKGCIYLIEYEGMTLGYCKLAQGRVYIYSLACPKRVGEEECW